MTYFKQIVAAPAIVLLLSGTAHAALTADQIWKSWQEGLTSAGLTAKAATEANSGGVLTLNGVTLSAGDNDETPLKIDTLTLTENSDGSVTIVPGASITVNGGTTEEGLDGRVGHEGLSLVAREGENGGIVYDYSADKVSVDFDARYPAASAYDFGETEEGAEPPKPEVASNKGTIVFEDLAGKYSDTPGTNRSFAWDLTSAKASYDIATVDPGIGSSNKANSIAEDVAVSFNMALPTTLLLSQIKSSADFGTALEQGLAITAKMSQGASSGTAVEENEFMPYEMKMTAGGGTADFVFNKEKVALNSNSDAVEIEGTSPAAPGPMKASLEGLTFGFLSPIKAVENAEAYGATLKFKQLALSDEVWSLFDGASVLKREPFDLAIDLDGLAKIDWLALASDEPGAADAAVPQPETLNIKEASLKLAGAALDATGALTFDNTAGFPMPLGEANIAVNGANQLIDGLIKLGFIQEQDAMGARMMMGAFMVPGSEPDSLTSKIEFKEGFQIFANGQRLQ